MHHTVAFTASLGAVTDSDVAALADQILPVVNGHFQPQTDMDLLWAFNAGLLVDRVRISTPKMRQVSLPFIRPINQALLPATDPNMADYRSNPYRLARGEEIAVQATTSAVGPTRVTTLLGLGISREPVPSGDIYTFRGTSATAAVANVWSDIALTFADQLPNGDYAVVGMEHFSANGFGARLIIDNQFYRPGCVSITGLGNRAPDMFRKGGLGVWGRFQNTSMPRVQVLCNAADAVHEVYLDILRLR